MLKRSKSVIVLAVAMATFATPVVALADPAPPSQKPKPAQTTSGTTRVPYLTFTLNQAVIS